MMKLYLKQCLKEFDRDIRKLPRQKKVEALDCYKLGLEASFHDSYPNKFTAPSYKPQEKYKSFVEKGIYTGRQFGSLEVDFAREFLLAEIEKRKNKFSKEGFLEQFYRLFGSFRERI